MSFTAALVVLILAGAIVMSVIAVAAATSRFGRRVDNEVRDMFLRLSTASSAIVRAADLRSIRQVLSAR